MEISYGLLVAMMYVMILSMGIGSLLGGVAGVVNKRTEESTDNLLASWMVLLLLVYFNLFWHTLDLLAIADWGFRDFLYVIAGPILIFFATTVLLPDGPSAARSHYFAVSRRFFALLALLQLWILGSDFVLGKGVTVPAAFNALFFCALVVLAKTRDPRFHAVGNGLAWMAFLIVVTLRGFGVMG